MALETSKEIDIKCANTLESAKEHTDLIAKKHRDKIAKIKADLAATALSLEESKVSQREALQEAQRTLRKELSTAAAAIHEAVKNLNDKQAATKAELSLTVERLNTLKEQCASEFSEMKLQAQALNVHSQEDLDKKLMKLYRYVQPTRCEWRIHKVSKKKKELTTPMLLKSPPFSIAGLKDLRFDWYPNGYYGLPAGTTCIRFYAPLNSHIKYEVYFGTLCDGPQEWKSGEESLWNDHLFHKWDDEVQHNQITIAVDILADLSLGAEGSIGGSLKIDCE